MLVAMDKNNRLILAHRKLNKEESYYCPSCKNKVHVKIGKVLRPHFAHYQKENCAVFSEGETKEHLTGKMKLADYFKRIGYEVQIEAYLPELKQRPDLLIVKKDKKIAIEFQCSSITIKKIIERSKGYFNAEYEVIWILGNQFCYKNYLTNFHKACLFHSSFSKRFFLFHYQVALNELTIRYNFQVMINEKMFCKKETIQTTSHTNFKILPKKGIKNERLNLNNLNKRHQQLMKNMKNPSNQLTVFLALLYKNRETIVSIPKEIYYYVPSEWMIESYPMNWKFQLILWIESHSIKEIITIRRLNRWLKEKIVKKEIIYFPIARVNSFILLDPILEFIIYLERTESLKKIGNYKWSYQQSFFRFKNLEEKLKKID